MAMDTALAKASPPLADEASRPDLRRLWQVPAFLLGVLTVLSVWAARPLWLHRAEDRVGPDLAAARTAFGRARPDVTRALALVEGVLSARDLSDAQAGEAHFLAGTCYL